MRWIHRLLLAWYGIRPEEVLNHGHPGGDARPGLAEELLRLIHSLLAEAGERGVDYRALAAGAAYREYRECTRRLQAFDPDTLNSREERLAFWINLYNALIVDAVIQLEVRRSVRQVRGFFWRAAYDIGGFRYAAFDIENGILRANAPHPAIPGPHFGRGDPRRRHSLGQLDPRLHFALVCAARSCPPIEVYQAGHIDEQLQLATRAFVNGGGVEVKSDCRAVRLSPIFQWYATDFGAWPLALGRRHALLDFVGPYLRRPEDRRCLKRGRPRLRFQAYDWSLNGLAAAQSSLSDEVTA